MNPLFRAWGFFLKAKIKNNRYMEKIDLIGEAVMSAIVASVFAIECGLFFFAGKPGFIIFLPLAWIFGDVAFRDIKAMRK